MSNFFKKEISAKIAFVAIGVLLVALLFFASVCKQGKVWSHFCGRLSPVISPIISILPPAPTSPPAPAPSAFEVKDIRKFLSEDDFKNYLAESKSASYAGFGFGRGGGEVMMLEAPTAVPKGVAPQTEIPERVSETTVQVAGVDEPDIVKTDGKEIYFSPGFIGGIWRGGIGIEESFRIMPPDYRQVGIQAIKAYPPADLKVDAEIKDTGGDLLLVKNILVAFNSQKIIGFDVKDPKSPAKKWEVKIEDNTSLAGSRLYSGKIYLITRQNINETRPCPIKPLIYGDTGLEIRCVDIYHPIYPVPIDATFTAMVLNPETGKIEKNISFVGSSGLSILYMSSNAIYITYSYAGDLAKFIFGFFKQKGEGIVSKAFIDKLEKLEGYDISLDAKMTEFQILWSKHLGSLSDDERLKAENEFSNRMSDYEKEHKRELEKTGIVKISVAGLELTGSGNVPGNPLNQFSLDEFEGNLRIAATIGGGWFGFGIGRSESANDVYVLDKNLKISGAVYDLGVTERIYSVRFIEDKGYVVTFRQVDPFYVLDLSDPKNPRMKGELKIPGYSSYLHPLAKNIILGVGQEDWRVKLSVFDVSSAEKPIEKDKYILDEGWTEVSSNYHAFLQDKKHEIFFLPGGKGGYIFSYADNNLKLVKAVSGIIAKRALYINDYLYIIGSDKIIVLNEADWQKVNELDLYK